MNLRTLAVALGLGVFQAVHAQPPERLELKTGDHIALVGGALPDRMQHFSHLEALLHAQYPNHQLVVRNLAAAGDEVVTRHRSENFGSPDDWLTRVKASVILAFFGFNESFKGYPGLEKFRNELDRYLKDLRSKNYSGQGAPRIVLFSPTAAEKHQDPNFPDPTERNAALSDYTAAMADVARANDIQFVDLLKPSQELYRDAAKRGQSLTVNGVYLTEAGDK